MASGPYSPLTLAANAGLLDNTAMVIPPELQDAIDNYLAAIATIDPPPVIGVDPPVLTNQVPPSYVPQFTTSGLPVDLFTNTIIQAGGPPGQAPRLLRSNLSETCQIFSTCLGYRTMANQAVNSVKNVDALGTAFTNMNDLSTGGITQLTQDPQIFGADLNKLGNLIDLKLVDYLGYPAALVAQILTVGGLLPGLRDALVLAGLPDSALSQIQQNPATVSQEINAKIYSALLMISGEDLAQVKELLDVTTANLTTAADLLNPKKILPLGYATIVQPPASYPLLTNPSYLVLSKVIPADQALDNTKLVYGFNQVKNIKNIAFSKFAVSVTAMEKTSSSTQILPPGTASAINSELATGTGPDDTLTIYDFLGTAIGYPHIESLNNIADDINSGTYDVAALTELWNGMNDQISREITNLDKAKVDFGSISNNLSAAMSLAMSLHDLGLDDSQNGPSKWLTAAADQSTSGGQALVGALKEGRNLKSLQDNGIGTNTQLSAD